MKTLFTCLLAGTLLTGMAFTAEAAKPIQFAKGKTSASVSGKVQGSNDVDHVIRANAGQTMTIDFKASKGAAYFNVLLPGSTGEAIFIGSNEGNHFKAVLPSDGDYIIRVYLMGGAKDSDKPVTYTLKWVFQPRNLPVPVKTIAGQLLPKKPALRLSPRKWASV